MQIPAKLSCPRLFDVFPRQKLFDLIDRKLHHPVVWIQGSPGSGKTTIVGSYIIEADKNTLWYQVDSRDEEPATFFNYLSQVAKQLDQRNKISLPSFTAEYRTNLDAFTRYFFEGFLNLLGEGGILVLDNMQEVDNDSPLYTVLNIAIEALGTSNNLLCISHTPPPSTLGRHQINQNITVLHDTDLRLSFEETSQLAHHYGITDQAVIDSCYELTQGWIGGAVQVLKQGKICDHKPNLQDATACLNNYFQHYVFEKIPEEHKTILLFTSLLDRVSTADVAYIFAIDKADSPLKALHQNNHFTYLANPEKEQYQYHPLFYKFLNQEAKKLLNTGQYAELLPRIVETLQQQDNIEGIADLYIETQDWQGLAQHIMLHAKNLLSLGQDKLLLSWLEALPKEIINSQAWMHFWYSSAIATTDLATGKILFDKSYQMFAESNDIAGMLMSWSLGIDCIVWQYHSWFTMNNEYEKIKDFANKEMLDQLPEEIRTVFLAGLMMCSYLASPNSEKAKECSTYGLKFLSSSSLGKENIKLAQYIFVYNYWIGNYLPAKIAVQAVKDIQRKYQLNQSETMLCAATDIVYSWQSGSAIKTIDLAKKYINAKNKVAPILFLYEIFSHGAYAAFSANRIKDCQIFCNVAESAILEIGIPDAGYIHSINMLLEKKAGNYEGALFHAKNTHAIIQRVGAIIPYILIQTIIINIHTFFGQYQEAEKLIIKTRIEEKKHSCLMTQTALGIAESLLAFKTNQKDKGLQHLEYALQSAKEGFIINYCGSDPDEMSELCVIALEESIETEFVQYIIKKRELKPAIPPIHLHNWPWKIRIQTLGEFQIIIDEEPLIFKRKPQKQVMALLKFLVLQGRKSIPEYLIVDALWEQSEGDAAHQNLKTTLFRLRKLLGDKEAILVQNGKISLNPYYFFVDFWAIEELHKQISVGKTLDTKDLRQLDQYQTTFQQQGFMQGDDEFWMQVEREQVRQWLS